MSMHHLEVRTEVLDAIIKSLMQTKTAVTKRRRRLDTNTKTGRDAAREFELVEEALDLCEEAQSASWDSRGP